MLWLGKPRSRAHDEEWAARYLSGNIGREYTPTQREEIARAEREFNARKPAWSEDCLVCERRNGWIAAEDEDGRRWVCAKCHRPQMKEAEAQAEKQRLRDEAAEQAAQKAAAKAAASTPSATRDALRAAIQRHDATVAEVSRLEAGTRKLSDAGTEMFQALEVAKRELATIRGTARATLIAEAIGDAPAGPKKTLRQAEQDLADAEQRWADRHAASEEIERRLRDAKQSVAWATDSVRRAALEAIGANSAREIRQFISETAKLQREIADRLRAMEWLKVGDLLTLDEATREVMNNFQEPTRNWPSRESSTVAKWEATVTALCADHKARAQIG